MKAYSDLLEVAKKAAQRAMLIMNSASANLTVHTYDGQIPREMKALADKELHNVIVEILRPTEIPILSEEACTPESHISVDSGLRWIVDPLDGTVNFVRGIGPCAISIGLWDGLRPIFGVVFEYPYSRLTWGGGLFGAYTDDKAIQVSEISNISEAVICTGFPSRYDFSQYSPSSFIELVQGYAKVRMLGSASLSLLHVARGSVDVYCEYDVMIWDVAASIAILEGAGGLINIEPGRLHNSFKVYASNGLIKAGES